MRKIKAFIVDDEVSNIKLLSHFLKKYCPNLEIIGQGTSSEEAIPQIKKHNPELLFLDIKLKNETGFDLLEKINYSKLKVIFITAYDQHAVKAFRCNATDYLLKPIQIEELINAVNKATKDMEKDNFTNIFKPIFTEGLKTEQMGVIAIPALDKIDVVRTTDVMYLTSQGKYTSFVMHDNSEIVASKNMGKYESILDGEGFFRIHDRYIVNIQYIKSIKKGHGFFCEMVNGKLIPVSKRRQVKLQNFLNVR